MKKNAIEIFEYVCCRGQEDTHTSTFDGTIAEYLKQRDEAEDECFIDYHLNFFTDSGPYDESKLEGKEVVVLIGEENVIVIGSSGALFSQCVGWAVTWDQDKLDPYDLATIMKA